LNHNSSNFTIFVISISFLLLEKSCLFTSFKILDLNSTNLSFEIEKPAACLCHQKAKNISFLFSKISIIEKYSGALQEATYFHSSSFNAIQGLWYFSVILPATIHIIQCGTSFEI
jgi:hypothetical protein